MKFKNINPNSVEYGEIYNEEMFEYAQKYPLAFINALEKSDDKIRLFILDELETPIHDLIDLELIYNGIDKVKIYNKNKSLIPNSIKIAGSKLGLKFGE